MKEKPRVRRKSRKSVKKSEVSKRGKKAVKSYTIVSWNVNSLRSNIVDKQTAKCKLNPRPINKTSPLGILIAEVNPDIICFQETKCTKNTRSCFHPDEYRHYWNCSTLKKGYSGVAIWTKTEPLEVSYDLPGLNTDSRHLLEEGRIITAHYPKFILVTTYNPNTLRAGTKNAAGKFANPEMMKHRKNWDRAMTRHLVDLKSQKPVVWCGDLNVARGRMDIYKGIKTEEKLLKYGDIFLNTSVPVKSPDYVEFTEDRELGKGEKTAVRKLIKKFREGLVITEYGGHAGYRLEERRALENLLSEGFVDIFRKLYPDVYGYTYWDMTIPPYRGVDYGLRLDYFIVSKNLAKKVRSVKVYPNLGVKKDPKRKGKSIVASDHAPVVLKMKL